MTFREKAQVVAIYLMKMHYRGEFKYLLIYPHEYYGKVDASYIGMHEADYYTYTGTNQIRLKHIIYGINDDTSLSFLKLMGQEFDIIETRKINRYINGTGRKL